MYRHRQSFLSKHVVGVLAKLYEAQSSQLRSPMRDHVAPHIAGTRNRTVARDVVGQFDGVDGAKNVFHLPVEF